VIQGIFSEEPFFVGSGFRFTYLSLKLSLAVLEECFQFLLNAVFGFFYCFFLDLSNCVLDGLCGKGRVCHFEEFGCVLCYGLL